MFNQVKMKKIEQLFSINESEANFIIKNQAKYLKINPEKLLNSYIVIHEEVKRAEERKAKEKRYNSKNVLILKYREEIVNLYCINGWGYMKISKAMKINHNAKISKSAIENFIKQNNLIKAEL